MREAFEEQGMRCRDMVMIIIYDTTIQKLQNMGLEIQECLDALGFNTVMSNMVIPPLAADCCSSNVSSFGDEVSDEIEYEIPSNNADHGKVELVKENGMKEKGTAEKIRVSGEIEYEIPSTNAYHGKVELVKESDGMKEKRTARKNRVSGEIEYEIPSTNAYHGKVELVKENDGMKGKRTTEKIRELDEESPKRGKLRVSSGKVSGKTSPLPDEQKESLIAPRKTKKGPRPSKRKSRSSSRRKKRVLVESQSGIEFETITDSKVSHKDTRMAVSKNPKLYPIVTLNCQFPDCKTVNLRWSARYGIRDLKDHVRVHRGKSALNCQHCEAVLRTTTSYYAHYKKRHKGEEKANPALLETEQDREELRRVWEQCFPGVSTNVSNTAVMRRRTFPGLNIPFARGSSSYVQVNIYDTNLEKLRARGVDIKHLLQHIGCLCIVMDVPVFSKQIRRSARLAGKLPGKLSGSSPARDQSPLLETEHHSSEDATASEIISAAHVVSLGSSRDEELCEELCNEEFMDCKTDFNSTMISRKSIGPLTSTPLPTKDVDSPDDFFNANLPIDKTCFSPGNGVEQLTFKTPQNTSEVPKTDVNVHQLSFTSEKFAVIKEEPSVNSEIGTGSVESSFTTFRSTVVEGMKSVEESKGPFLDTAENCGNSTMLSMKNLMSKEKNVESDDQLSCAQGIGKEGAEFEMIEQANIKSQMKRTKRDKSSISTTPSHQNFFETAVGSTCPAPTMEENRVREQHLIEYGLRLEQNQNGAAKSAELPISTGKKRKRERPTVFNTREYSSREPDGAQGGEDVCERRIAKRKSTTATKDARDERVFRCQIPLCQKELLWRPRYGKNRLVDHVRTHWGRAVKRCKLCDFKASNFRKVHHHHTISHPDQPYFGALSVETKEDLDDLLELWKQCFPGAAADKCIADSLPLTGSRAYSLRRRFKSSKLMSTNFLGDE